MKALLIFCALVGVWLGIITSCGPSRPFCPNNPPEYNCINNSDAAALDTTGTGGNSGCTMTIFICNGQSHCGPCT